MKIQSLNATTYTPGDIVFGASAVNAGIAAVVMAAFFGLFTYVLIFGHIGSFDPPRFMSAFFALFLLLFVWLTFHAWRAACRPSNWIMRVRGNDVFIKYRSFENWPMSDDDPQVIVLHRDEIAFVRKATHSQLTHDPEHGTQKTTFIDLEIGLNNPDTSALEKALAEEAARPGWGGRSQTKFLDFPVQVLDKGIVKITWRGTGCSMRPGIESALGTLASLTTVQNETRADDDLTVSALRELPEDQQKTKLKQLALRDRTSAIETARRLYKTSLGEAKTMVEGLIADRQTPAT